MRYARHPERHHRRAFGSGLRALGSGCVGATLIMSASVCLAADSKESPTVQKTKEGLHFQLPEDWPVEKRGGVMAPIPIEEYLSRKFSAIDLQLQLLEQRVNGLDVRVRVAEEELKKQRQRNANDQSPNNNNQTIINTQ